MKKCFLVIAGFAVLAMIFTSCIRKTAETSEPAGFDIGVMDEQDNIKEIQSILLYDPLAKQAYDRIMPQSDKDIFFAAEGKPINWGDFSVTEDIIQRGYEGTPEASEYTLYLVQKNGFDIMNISGGEIIIVSDIIKTSENIGVNSTIEEFAGAYADFEIYYTYVSDKCWLSTEKYPRIQFLLDKNDFLAEWDGSTIMELKISDFSPNSKINRIRVYEDEWLFLH